MALVCFWRTVAAEAAAAAAAAITKKEAEGPRPNNIFNRAKNFR